MGLGILERLGMPMVGVKRISEIPLREQTKKVCIESVLYVGFQVRFCLNKEAYGQKTLGPLVWSHFRNTKMDM